MSKMINVMFDERGDQVGEMRSEESCEIGVHVLFHEGMGKLSECYYFRDGDVAARFRDEVEAKYWYDVRRVELCRVESFEEVVMREERPEWMRVVESGLSV